MGGESHGNAFDISARAFINVLDLSDAVEVSSHSNEIRSTLMPYFSKISITNLESSVIP
jgi:hypothetical protein